MFEIWNKEVKKYGASETKIGTKEHVNECADYFMETLEKVNTK